MSLSESPNVDTGLLVILFSMEGFANAVKVCLEAGYPEDEVYDEGTLGMLRPEKGDWRPQLWLTGSANFCPVGEPESDGTLMFEHRVDEMTRIFELRMNDVSAVHRTGV